MKFRNLTTAVVLCLGLYSFAQIDGKSPEPEQYPFNNIGDTSRGVFGADDRMEVKDAVSQQDYVRATAVMINKKYIKNNKIKAYTLRDRLYSIYGVNKFDESVKFLDQPTIANCTGFLLAPDIIATAGHCIDDKSKYKDYVWVFDYTLEKYKGYTGIITLDANDIYEVDETIGDRFEGGYDYAFIRLKRKCDRKPYRFRTSGEVAAYSNVYTIGSPTGLPLKFVDNSYVQDTRNALYFKNNIDGFPGNSGGPVFNKSGFIEGIHVRGAAELSDGKYTSDYKYDESCECVTTIKFTSALFNAGSQAHRITAVPADILYTILYENIEYAIEENNLDRLSDWIAYTFMVEADYTVKRGRFEFIAAKNNNLDALKMLMYLSKDKSAKDSKGRNLLYYAISNNNTEMLNYLLRAGISPNAADSYKTTPLHWAISSGRSEMAQLLVTRGASVTATNNDGNTALHLAAMAGDMGTVKALVAKGASLDAKNNDGWTPKKAAAKSKNKAIKKYLKMAAKGKV